MACEVPFQIFFSIMNKIIDLVNCGALSSVTALELSLQLLNLFLVIIFSLLDSLIQLNLLHL